MNDGCPDGWAGRIPVCALPGSVQSQENCSNSLVSRAVHERDNSTIMERDYIGLGLSGPLQDEVPGSTQVTDEKMDCDNVELSLGLGRSEKVTVEETTVMELGSSAVEDLVVPKGCPKPQRFWHQNFRVSLSNDRIQQSVNCRSMIPDVTSVVPSGQVKTYSSNSSGPLWGPVPGRFTIPVPKVSTVPAKRPYQDAANESRALEAVPHVLQSGVPMYAWSSDPYGSSSPSGGGWQHVHVNFEHAHVHGSGISSASNPLAMAPRQLNSAGTSGSTGFNASQMPSAVVMPPTNNNNGGPSSFQSPHSSQPEVESDANHNKAPVVGWPPVRSFRKNTLQASRISNRMSAEDMAKSVGGTFPHNAVDGAQDVGNVSLSKNGFFVKAKLDGVRICRKVDLKAYDSYSGLKAALQEMFQGFVSDNTKLDLLTGTSFVLTHEDKDGDCLLVGDVPWKMFLESSVKSLRIMKALDAIGIGEKGSTKLKVQDPGKLPATN